MKSFPRQAIVLAAGLGTRLKPLTDRVPKPVLPVGGVPILLFNLYLLHHAGVREITINLHHRPQALRNLLRPAKKLGLKLRFSLEPRILGTAGGISQAIHKMRPVPTIVLNGDILFNLNLNKMWQDHIRHEALATLAVVSPQLAKVNSFVEYDSSGRIFRIAGEPNLPTPRPKLRKGIFSGAHIIHPKLFLNFPKNTFGCVIRQIYQPVLSDGQRLQAFVHQGPWWDLGSLPELKKVDRMLWTNEAPADIGELWRQVQLWSRPLFS